MKSDNALLWLCVSCEILSVEITLHLKKGTESGTHLPGSMVYLALSTVSGSIDGPGQLDPPVPLVTVGTAYSVGRLVQLLL